MEATPAVMAEFELGHYRNQIEDGMRQIATLLDRLYCRENTQMHL